MRRASIGEAQHNLSELIRQVATGGEVGITRHKRVVARIVPAHADWAGGPADYPDFADRASRMFSHPSGVLPGHIVAEGREERA